MALRIFLKEYPEIDSRSVISVQAYGEVITDRLLGALSNISGDTLCARRRAERWSIPRGTHVCPCSPWPGSHRTSPRPKTRGSPRPQGFTPSLAPTGPPSARLGLCIPICNTTSFTKSSLFLSKVYGSKKQASPVTGLKDAETPMKPPRGGAARLSRAGGRVAEAQAARRCVRGRASGSGAGGPSGTLQAGHTTGSRTRAGDAGQRSPWLRGARAASGRARPSSPAETGVCPLPERRVGQRQPFSRTFPADGRPRGLQGPGRGGLGRPRAPGRGRAPARRA